ncbi:MAG: NAD-dependent epimerase/dehydratase family protein [Bacteroidia bacterium]|nr:NAD-dependent epimerase/dehydratase family protein [Bacteroidia bacterium]
MVLVTGGTGLVGSHLLLQLAKQEENIRALIRKSSSMRNVKLLFEKEADLFERIEWMEGDILDVSSLTDAMQGIEKVYHCAAMISFVPKDRVKMLEINRNGTANVINLCLEMGVKKLCYASSVAAINRINESELITESTAWEENAGNSNYAVSKQAAEREVWRGIAEGLKAVMVNPGIIIGPGSWNSGSGKLFSSVWEGLKFYSEGMSGFVSADDVARAMIALMESEIDAERFIVVSENLTYREVLFQIADSLGKKRPSLKANKFLSEAAWRLAALASVFSGKTPLITRETAASGLCKVKYSNEKIRKATGMEFEKIQPVIEHTASVFLKQHQPVRR